MFTRHKFGTYQLPLCVLTLLSVCSWLSSPPVASISQAAWLLPPLQKMLNFALFESTMVPWKYQVCWEIYTVTSQRMKYLECTNILHLQKKSERGLMREECVDEKCTCWFSSPPPVFHWTQPPSNTDRSLSRHTLLTFRAGEISQIEPGRRHTITFAPSV